MESITLKQARLLREKTQEHMANLLGIHVQTYRKLEENPDEVTIGQAKLLSEDLRFSYDTIFLTNNSTLSRTSADNPTTTKSVLL